MRVATKEQAGIQEDDVLLGLRIRVQDAGDEKSFREGRITEVTANPRGWDRIQMRVERRVVDLNELSVFDVMWDFDSDIPMQRVVVDWNAKGLRPRPARGVMSERARASA